jgi:hypothetical protein
MANSTPTFFLVYKTVNTLNEKFYIGCHKTTNINDGYLGSGKLLRRAILKYGPEVFRRDIIYSCNSEDEMFAHERELVSESVVADPQSYNLKIGGEGGWDYINRSGINGNLVLTSEELSMKNKKGGKAGADAVSRKRKEDPAFDKHLRDASRRNIQQMYRERGRDWCFKEHTPESKEKIRQSHIGKHTGSQNPVFGTKWMFRDGQQKRVWPKDFEQHQNDGWSFQNPKRIKKQRSLPEHGSHRRYQTHKCRCDLCRAARAKIVKEWRKKQKDIGK